MPTTRITVPARHGREFHVTPDGLHSGHSLRRQYFVGADLTAEQRLDLVLALLCHSVDRGETSSVESVVEGVNALLATLPSRSFHIEHKVEYDDSLGRRDVVNDNYRLVVKGIDDADYRYMLQAIDVTAPRVLLQGDLAGARVQVVRDHAITEDSGPAAPIGFEGIVDPEGVDEDGEVGIRNERLRYAHASAVRVLEEAGAAKPAPEQPEVEPLSAAESRQQMQNIRRHIGRLRAERQTPIRVRLRDDLAAGILKHLTVTTADPTKEPTGYTLHGLPAETFTRNEHPTMLWNVVVEEPTLARAMASALDGRDVVWGTPAMPTVSAIEERLDAIIDLLKGPIR